MNTYYQVGWVIVPWALFVLAVIGNVVGWWIAWVLHRSNGLAQAQSRESTAAHQEAVRKLELEKAAHNLTLDRLEESQTKAARAQDLFNDNVRLTEELNRFKPEIASVPIKIKFPADGRNPSILGKTFTHPAGGIIRVSGDKKPKKAKKPVKKAKKAVTKKSSKRA